MTGGNGTHRRSWPALGLAAALIVSLAGLWGACLLRNDISLLVDRPPAHWIVYPRPGCARIVPAVPMETAFRRDISFKDVPGDLVLRVRAFRACSIRVNGRAIALTTSPEYWKREASANVSRFLRAGRNEIVVSVTNDRGPPALWLALISSTGAALVSDPSWTASLAGASGRQAILASAPIRYPSVDPFGAAERVFPAIAAVWPLWVFYAAVALVAVLLLNRWRRRDGAAGAGGHGEGIIPYGAVLISIALWAVLFVHNSAHLPAGTGFDASGHLDYINYVQQRRSLPLAGEGWSMFHPPLYYVLTAILLACGRLASASPAGILAIRVFNLALAAANLFSILGVLRILFPKQPRRQVIGVLFAAFLPMHLYLFQYPTNEILGAALASVSSYLVLRIVSAPETGAGRYALAGLALGAALLSKVTAILLVPATAVVLIAKVAGERSAVRRRRDCIGFAVLGAVALSLCGWHYFRTWSRYGTPVVSNLDARVFMPYWQDPGYLSPAYYLRFGESLRAPLFSFWNSIWDGLYSTMWADADIGGVSWLAFRPPWSYQSMVAGIALSLPLSAGVLWGAALSLAQFARKPALPWAFLLTLLGTAALFLLWFTASCPFYSANKAFYALPTMSCLCALAALGLDSWSVQSRWTRGGISVFLGIWALNSMASFWVNPSGVGTRTCELTSAQGDPARTLAGFEQLTKEYPDDNPTRLWLCRLYLQAGRKDDASRVLKTFPAKPDLAARHYLLAVLDNNKGQADHALRELRRATALAPYDEEPASLSARILAARGDQLGAISAGQNVLGINPYSGEHHAMLAKAYALAGRQESSRRHQEYVRRFNDWAERLSPVPDASGLKAGLHGERRANETSGLGVGTPGSAAEHYNRGLLFHQSGRLADAIAQYREALRIRPGDPDTHNNLGVALLAVGRAAEAVDQQRQALRANPKYPYAHYNMGLALQSLGNTAEALEQYQQALKLKPDYAEAEYGLGTCLDALKRPAEALEHYKAALRLNPGFAPARERAEQHQRAPAPGR